MNWRGLYTLLNKEIWRFLKVTVQTILTPVITVLLYLLVFNSALADHVRVYEQVSYIAFLIPGLMMMSIIQNAFANSSSSLFQSKMTGNLFFILVAPLSILEFYLAYILAAVVRGLLVGLGVWLAACGFVALPMNNVFILIYFSVLGSAVLGSLGLIAALWADRWDHISAFQNFVILPLSFLSGVFYKIETLPDFWEQLSYYNPFFYMIDGFRFGFIGHAESPLGLSMLIVLLVFIAVAASCLGLLHSGYKIRS